MAEKRCIFTTEKPSLNAALSAVKEIVNNSDKIPILTHILFDRTEDGVCVTGTNLDQQITAPFAAEIGEGFEAFACPAKMMVDIVRNAPEGFNITLNAIYVAGKFSDVEIRAGKFGVKLQVLPPGDFPSLGTEGLDHEISLKASTFARALKTVSFATETNEQRYAWCGVHLDPVDDGIMVVGSDANRLARRFIPPVEFDQDVTRIPAVTIPNAAISPIIRILDKQEDVAIRLSDDKIRIEAGGSVLISKLLDGKFIPYKQFVAGQLGVSATFSAVALANSISRVLTVNSDKSKGVGLDFAHGRAAVYSRDDLGREASDEIEIQCTGNLRQGFNGENLKAALEHLDRDEVEFIVGEDTKVSQLQSPADPLTVMMLGPMRPKWNGFFDVSSEREA